MLTIEADNRLTIRIKSSIVSLFYYSYADILELHCFKVLI